ncbi:hypothetical protein K0U00_10295, partial [Paenibacillus sepulcri]|nr:hypothetical protein [Paenibacillus sepulcri]
PPPRAYNPNRPPVQAAQRLACSMLPSFLLAILSVRSYFYKCTRADKMIPPATHASVTSISSAERLLLLE